MLWAVQGVVVGAGSQRVLVWVLFWADQHAIRDLFLKALVQY